MTENFIITEISTKEITFKPGDIPAVFEVTALNKSNRFASFQLEIIAAGADPHRNSDWYTISPEVSTKQPPGDRTSFRIAITDTPIPGFVGIVNLTVRVFSLELPNEQREILRLILEMGTGSTPLKIELPIRDFQVFPNSQIEVLVRVTNPGQLAANAILKISELNLTWLNAGTERQLQLGAGKQAEIAFSCQIPDVTQAASKVYPFMIEATQSNGPPSKVEGSMEVLPMGSVEFHCHPKKHDIPAKRPWIPNWRSRPVIYYLEFENKSNLHQQVSVKIEGEELERCTLDMIPELTNLSPGETSQIQLRARSPRHWLGRRKKVLLEVASVLSDRRLGNTNPATQLLKLQIFPIIHAWLLLVGVPLLLWLAWLSSCLNPENRFCGHQESVNSVQFNGIGQDIISGSSDQTALEWRVNGFFNPLINQVIGRIGNPAGKALRVVKYRPVDNNIIAVGLENGEIQFRDLARSKGELMESFFYQKDDRVLAIEFTRDSRYLFSGHGSGLVLQWNLDFNLEARQISFIPKQPLRKKQFDFAVYTIKLMGEDESHLIVAGRYNQLLLWNLKTDKIRKLSYRTGGQDDYIFSIDVAEFKPDILAVADNQGYITLWNMRQCLAGGGGCQILDEWLNGHGGRPVPSIALSSDGCYLTSAGDDGRIMLWPLTVDGKRSPNYLNGKQIKRVISNKKFNSIDIKVVDGRILIATGNDDTRVRVQQTSRLPELGCDKLQANE
jgi:WD40 repeat protein